MEENMSNDCNFTSNFVVEPFYYNERVDVVDNDNENVLDGQITSIRGNIIVVKYTQSGEVENIHIDDNIILKQCKKVLISGKPGRPFKKMNRVDIKNNETKNFYEGFIIEVKF